MQRFREDLTAKAYDEIRPLLGDIWLYGSLLDALREYYYQLDAGNANGRKQLE